MEELITINYGTREQETTDAWFKKHDALMKDLKAVFKKHGKGLDSVSIDHETL